MAYTTTNFKTKKALKEAVALSQRGPLHFPGADIPIPNLDVTVFQPGPFGPEVKDGDNVPLEGPHFPEPHRWYASAVVRDGKVVKVK